MGEMLKTGTKLGFDGDIVKAHSLLAYVLDGSASGEKVDWKLHQKEWLRCERDLQAMVCTPDSVSVAGAYCFVHAVVCQIACIFLVHAMVSGVIAVGACLTLWLHHTVYAAASCRMSELHRRAL